METWQLRPKEGFRHRLGHPWVFRRELKTAPDGHVGLVEMRDENNRWISAGFGSADSALCYRELTRDPEERDLGTVDFFHRRLNRAWDLRTRLGLTSTSFRWVYSEADRVSGLIIDVFRHPSNRLSVAIQPSSPGMIASLPAVQEAAAQVLKQNGFVESSVRMAVLKNSHELVEAAAGESGPLWIRNEFRDSCLVMHYGRQEVTLEAPLLEGQKTGFFLDQRTNVESLLALLDCGPKPSQLRILDLFSYVGQWSAALAAWGKTSGSAVEILSVDVSAKALVYAEKNAQRAGADSVAVQQLDIVKDLAQTNFGKFDVVICDPPALIKRKKDRVEGLTAYQKLNRDAVKLVAPGGWFVSCSCSQNLSSSDLDDILHTGLRKAGLEVQWVHRGSQAADHPLLARFPEGEYLKARMGIVN